MDLKYLGNNDVLNYNLEPGIPARRYTAELPAFSNRAKKEIKEMTWKESLSPVVTVYTESGYTFHTVSPDRTLILSLVGQDYVFSPCIKKITYCCTIGTFAKKGKKFILLWESMRLIPKATPTFLNKKLLEKNLQKVFTDVQIKLGQLQEKGVRIIAWQVTTKEGIFYVPWHNGCLIPKKETFSFEEKEFEEIRRTYKVLRFARVQEGDVEAYLVLCA